MKKITLIGAFLALMILGNRSMAQSRLTPDQMKEMKEKFNDFKTKLNLSDDQIPNLPPRKNHFVVFFQTLPFSDAFLCKLYNK
ncbi:hypothetical protein [Mucilaginibacter lappiensis]|jgi:hypothetical protein|uniref:hypothetical protein n=1 Tax=Mucilaginibacter lappiensis TaxID=354630 RepID=UPI003D203EE5